MQNSCSSQWAKPQWEEGGLPGARHLGEQIRGAFEATGSVAALGERLRLNGCLRFEQFAKRRRQRPGISLAGFEPIAGAQFFHPPRIVHLIKSKRNNELRRSRGQRFGDGADAAMMNDGAAQRKKVL